MFELRRLSLQQRPVSEFGGKRTLEEHFSKRPQLAKGTPQQQMKNGPESSSIESASEEPQESSGQPRSEELVEVMPVASTSINEQLAASEAEGEEQQPSPENLRPEEIRNDMQTLQELRVVQGILQGPIHEQIDQSLREVLAQERQPGHRRSRPRPRPHPARAEESEEGGDEMNQNPMGRLLAAASRRQRGARGRRVRFRSQLPTPNSDGRYSVPRRDQGIIVERLRQSPTLNSLGEEDRDEIVAEVGNLVSQQLVTSALAGEFRGILELHIQVNG